MKIIGLTGGSGAGKSTVCNEFMKYNAAVLDADKSYFELCESCTPMLNKLQSVFIDAFNTDGTLNRKKLGEIVFNDKEKLDTLNAITHPYILQTATDFFINADKSGIDLCVYDAPLLFEAGADALCDINIAVLADKDIRIKRIMSRDGISREYASKRIASQHSDEWYREHCDFCIVNNGNIEALHQQVSSIVQTIIK